MEIFASPTNSNQDYDGDETSSLTTYQSNGFKESTPPQNHQVTVIISNKKKIDGFAGELTLSNPLDQHIL